jgi:hypothetical protein
MRRSGVIAMRHDQKSPTCEEQAGPSIEADRSKTIYADYSIATELLALDDGLNIAADIQHLSQHEIASLLRWLRRAKR